MPKPDPADLTIRVTENPLVIEAQRAMTFMLEASDSRQVCADCGCGLSDDEATLGVCHRCIYGCAITPP